MPSANVQLHTSRIAPDGWDISQSTSKVLRCDGESLVTTLKSSVGIEKQWSDPLAALDWMATHFGDSGRGRWVGYLSYDLGRFFENLPSLANDDLRLPLFVFGLCENHGDEFAPAESRRSSAELISTLPREQYLGAVRRAIDFIYAGDVFQVNLSQRFSLGLPKQPRAIWRDLIARSPAAFGAYLDFGDHALLCNSPELFLKVTSERRVITRPIKGTRPKLPGMAIELRDSIKDQAELNMIVDLERNDLGRMCEIGSVKVTEPRTIESHPTIYHGVATIEGVLRPDVGFVELLRATFPGGSITGAPKIRAMEIIEELEPVRRGPYCGAIGYLTADGSMQFNIAIRTMIVKDGLVHIAVGGGIVADSDPAMEYEETLVKAQAMFRALDIIL